MALSKKKQDKLAREARVEYVKSAAYGSLSIASPFMDANWDAAAMKYIETGDESLKTLFPSPRA